MNLVSIGIAVGAVALVIGGSMAKQSKDMHQLIKVSWMDVLGCSRA